MTQTIEAIYQKGVLRPLEPLALVDGQHVSMTLEIETATKGAAREYLDAWAKVYEGLSEEDIADIEKVALDRSNFSRFNDED